MSTPFPFESWAKPGKDAFEFWISFFPTAPMFGVKWRFADMMAPGVNALMAPGMNPFAMQPPTAPFFMPGAAAPARPGELDTPARVPDAVARPVAKAAEKAGDAASEMTRIAAETGRAAAQATARAAKEKPATQTTAPERAESRSGTAGDDVRRAAEKAAKPGSPASGEAREKAAEQIGEAWTGTRSSAATAVEQIAASVEAIGRQTSDVSPDADEAIAAAPKPKMLLAKKPERTDDLKMIKGIGPGLERQLNELGVWRLDQIARMSESDLAWIDANLTSFKGRCFRDDWVGQARARLSH